MLCHIVTAANRAFYAQQLEEMHRQRHELFVETLGWRELRRDDGRDIDAYDTDDSVYLLVLGDAGELFASGRMNPTWGRHQLEPGSPLKAKFAMREPPRGPQIWEGSRLLGGLPKRFGKDVARRSLGVLLVGTQEFCARRCVPKCISILETQAFSRFQSLGWTMEPLSLSVSYDTDRGPGRGDAMSAIWSTGPKELAMTREAFGVEGPAMFEAPPAVGGDTQIDHQLLHCAADIRRPALQEKALAELQSLLTQQYVGEAKRSAMN